MKNTILLLLSLAFTQLSAKSIITGKITGDIPERIQYTVPANGVSFWGFAESIQIPGSGEFEIEIDYEKASFVEIIIPQRMTGRMIIEPGKSYSLEIHIQGKEKSFLVSSDDQEAQLLIEQLPKAGFIQGEARKYMSIESVSELNAKLEEERKEQLAPFLSLHKAGKISDEFLELLKIDRECLYHSLRGTVALLKYYMDKREKSGAFGPEFQSLAQEAFHSNLLNDTRFQTSPAYFEWIRHYVDFQRMMADDFDENKLKEASKNGKYNSLVIQDAQKYLQGASLEYYIASFLYFKAFQKKYEQELIDLLAEFKQTYPQSAYSSYLDPLIQPIITYHEIVEKPFSEKVSFVDNYGEINSFAELLTHFQGEQVYIDVWATWCGPCKREFAHKEGLYKVLAENKIKVLYISIDREAYDEKWKGNIKYYGLEGHHVRVNQKLQEDLARIFGMEDGSLLIPWYILIDKEGNIAKKKASRPSNLAKLREEIAELQ